MSGIATVVYSNYASGKAADDAATGQKDAAAVSERANDKNIEFQKWLWGEQKDLLAPYADSGKSAIQPYMSEVNKGMTVEDMYNDPGYQFGLNEGVKAYDSSASAKGNQLSGAQAKALTRFGNDYGSTKYNESFNRRQVGLDNLYRMIAMGSNAAGGQATTGTSMGTQVSSSITGTGNAQNAAYQNIGNIRAAQEMAPLNTILDVGNIAANAYGSSQGGS